MGITWFLRITGLLSLLLLALVQACTQDAAAGLPDDPGLMTDDLGLGLTLGLDESAARSRAGELRSKVEVQVTTREELNRQSPYTQTSPGQALIIALYPSTEDEDPATSGPGGSGCIDEFRCYLPESGETPIRLLGRPAMNLSPDSVRSAFGTPYDETNSPDGKLHLTYYYRFSADNSERPADTANWAVKLVISFTPLGRCCAFALSTSEAPRTE
jgi:hypothetical protein